MGMKKSGDTVAKLQARLAELTARKCQALIVDLPQGVMLMMGCPASARCPKCSAARRRMR